MIISGVRRSWIILLIALFMFDTVNGFLIGGCIGPKKVFEKYLNSDQRKELARIVENSFDGRNRDQV